MSNWKKDGFPKQTKEEHAAYQRKWRAEHKEQYRAAERARHKRRVEKRRKKKGKRCAFCESLLRNKRTRYCETCRARPEFNRLLRNMYMRRHYAKRKKKKQETIPEYILPQDEDSFRAQM